MEDFIKHNSGDRKPEHYFGDPGEAYFEGLSGEVFSRIHSERQEKKPRFSFLLRPVLVAGLAGIIVLAVFLWPQGSAVVPTETASEEEIMIDILAKDIDLNEDAEILLPASSSDEDVIDMMSTEEMEEYYEEITHEDI